MHEDFAESFASYVHAIMLASRSAFAFTAMQLLLQFDNYWEAGAQRGQAPAAGAAARQLISYRPPPAPAWREKQ